MRTARYHIKICAKSKTASVSFMSHDGYRVWVYLSPAEIQVLIAELQQAHDEIADPPAPDTDDTET